MSGKPGRLTIRSFREGEEAVLAVLFDSHAAGFVGPIRVTAAAWREQFRRRSWNAPSLEDRDCCRVAERDGQVVGYAITDYHPMDYEHGAMVQELCVVSEGGEDEIAQALIADAEQRAMARGKSFILLQLSPEDGTAAGAAAARGYAERNEEGGVFMAAIRDLPGFLAEIQPALRSRLAVSQLRAWRGAVNIISGEQSARLAISDGSVQVREHRGAASPSSARRRASADVIATIRPEALPLMLFGRTHVGELYSQDAMAVSAPDTEEALRLLDALFPRMPLLLPRAQWW